LLFSFHAKNWFQLLLVALPTNWFKNFLRLTLGQTFPCATFFSMPQTLNPQAFAPPRLCGQEIKIWKFKTHTHIFAPVLLTITYQERQREMAQ
jgi:hypothetical protein